METESAKISDEKIFWIQNCITIVFGIMTYYLLEFLPFGRSLPVEWGSIGQLMLLFSLYFVTLLVIPFLFLHFKAEESKKRCLIRSLKSIGTQIMLYLFLCGFIFMVNI